MEILKIHIDEFRFLFYFGRKRGRFMFQRNILRCRKELGSFTGVPAERVVIRELYQNFLWALASIKKWYGGIYAAPVLS
jgi:hypothetical protein